MSLRGRSAAVAILKPKAWHPGTKQHHTKMTAYNKMRPFSKQKRSNFVSLRGRSAAVAILKPKAWHPGTKYGSRNRQNSKILIRPAGTPPQRYTWGAISYGREAVYHMRQHISCSEAVYHCEAPLRPARAYFRFSSQMSRTAMSAGETPEIRPACPMLCGRIALSFCRASRRSPWMPS